MQRAGQAASLLGEIKELKLMPKKEEALAILQRIFKEVEPVMKKHNLRVKKLSEFFPGNANLLGLNINAGTEIKIRLRPSFDKGMFLPFHELVGTMLHELSHNKHGNHGPGFYKYLDELWKDLESFPASSSSTGTAGGSAFSGDGRRLGASRIDTRSDRVKILEAAQARANRPIGGVYRLGSSTVSDATSSSSAVRGRDAREMAVRAALKRRQEADDKWCGVGSSPENPIEIVD